ncbi:MAG: GbsR/MarR family transcriptional regulator [Bacteroidales bacterium]
MSSHTEKEHFIEDNGLLFEKLGVTRMSGRILGYLMVTDRDKVSFSEFTEALKASKSSISTNLKMLLHIGFVKPLTIPGERKTYYMLSPDMDWGAYFSERLEMMKIMNNMFKKGLSLRSGHKDNAAQWLQEAIEFYSFFIEEFPAMLKRWEEKSKKK